jgi:LmbE family N-acetylglucosaminyl deacetylase
MADSVLIIAAHPDDEVLGCGGTMARLASEGHEVYVMILGEGVTSRYVRREDAGAELLDDLHSCTHEAGKLLGVKDIFMFDLPDNRFDTVPLLEVIKLIEGVIERVRPAAIYAQHGGDLNIDHATVYRATLAATRPVPGSSVARVHAFEVASSTEWSFGQFAPAFQPNVFVDISATLDLKIRAMACYKDEIRPFPHPRSAEALRAIAQRWGSVAGVLAAEAFALVREIR